MTYIPKFPMERDKVVSDKEKVLAKWPDAYCEWNTHWKLWMIHRRKGLAADIGRDTEPEAWADAARRLEDGK